MAAHGEAMDHRVGTRVPMDTRAYLRAAGVVTETVVKNASLTGAFVESPWVLPLLSPVQVRPVGTGGPWLEACVIRRDKHGLGLEWLEAGVHPVRTLLYTNYYPKQRPERIPQETSLQEDALARAQAEVASGEIDMQG